MGEKIFDLITNFATGKHSKVFWGVLIIAIISTAIVFPYIDANFLYYNRIEKRIDNLSGLVTISGKSLEDSPELLAEYNNILDEIKAAQEKSITSLIGNGSNSEFDFWVKFSGGAILFALVGIYLLFQRKKEANYTVTYFLKNNLLIFVFCIFLAGVLGVFFSKTPTFGSVWVNFVGAPIVELIIIYLLFLKPKNK